MCGRTDKPVAGLLKDLKRRGLLESTLVIWGGEFGRMPMSESRKGRDHNPHGFCYWMAGGGIKGGTIHGATDAVGLRAAVDRVHVHDLHATILHLLGPRPHPAHLPPQRPRRPPDRYLRHRHSIDHMNRTPCSDHFYVYYAMHSLPVSASRAGDDEALGVCTTKAAGGSER